MLAGSIDAVIGVDTHRDTHTAAILDPNGGLLTTMVAGTNQAGYQELLGWVRHRAPGRRCWALEGTGSYGAGLAQFLAVQGEWVVEVNPPKRSRQGKSDALDAERAGRQALASAHLATPRQRGQREALRVLHLARASAVQVYADARRLLKALLVTAPAPLRDELRGRPWRQLAGLCAGLVAPQGAPVEHRATLSALRATAERLLAADQQAGELEREIRKLVGQLAPALLGQPGVGPITATQVLLAWSHPGRVRSEAAFAMLGGAAPIPASSGRTVRYRLNRGGDRQLNRALHTIVVSRERHHEPTRRYVARRTAEGKTIREVRRCLKRAIARQLYRLLERSSSSLTTCAL
jgi:transposase